MNRLTVLRSFRSLCALAFVALATVVLCGPVSAQTTPTVQDVGVNITGWITTMASQLGLVVAVALAAMVAFLIIRKGYGWLRRAG